MAHDACRICGRPGDPYPKDNWREPDLCFACGWFRDQMVEYAIYGEWDEENAVMKDNPRSTQHVSPATLARMLKEVEKIHKEKVRLRWKDQKR